MFVDWFDSLFLSLLFEWSHDVTMDTIAFKKSYKIQAGRSLIHVCAWAVCLLLFGPDVRRQPSVRGSIDSAAQFSDGHVQACVCVRARACVCFELILDAVAVCFMCVCTFSMYMLAASFFAVQTLSVCTFLCTVCLWESESAKLSYNIDKALNMLIMQK